MTSRTRKSRRRLTRCQFSGKVRFKSPNDAKLAIRQARAARAAVELAGVGVTRRQEVRWYGCSCGGFHTSSQTAENREAFYKPVAGWSVAGGAAAGMARVAMATRVPGAVA